MAETTTFRVFFKPQKFLVEKTKTLRPGRDKKPIFVALSLLRSNFIKAYCGDFPIFQMHH